MRQQIRRFGVVQTAKVAGVVYFLVGLVFIPFFLVMPMFGSEEAGFGLGLALAIPVGYGLLGFVGMAIICAIYNFVAKMVGGIEVETDSGGRGEV